ncbi:MAG: cation-transporting P-type ATPase, partial [Methanoregula sp.]|nr:cation-transporting P-type ATPase [Methanoregula sp.]
MLTFEELREFVGQNGLQTSRVDELRKKFGANTMTPPVREPLWKQYL